MNIKAINDSDGTPVTITPCVLQDIPGYANFSGLAFYDYSTGNPIFQDSPGVWNVLSIDDGYNITNAETITGVYGADNDEWEASANEQLADYGFKLGEYVEVFPFKVATPTFNGNVEYKRYDGYMLNACVQEER